MMIKTVGIGLALLGVVACQGCAQPEASMEDQESSEAAVSAAPITSLFIDEVMAGFNVAELWSTNPDIRTSSKVDQHLLDTFLKRAHKVSPNIEFVLRTPAQIAESPTTLKATINAMRTLDWEFSSAIQDLGGKQEVDAIIAKAESKIASVAKVAARASTVTAEAVEVAVASGELVAAKGGRKVGFVLSRAVLSKVLGGAAVATGAVLGAPIVAGTLAAVMFAWTVYDAYKLGGAINEWLDDKYELNSKVATWFYGPEQMWSPMTDTQRIQSDIDLAKLQLDRYLGWLGDTNRDGLPDAKMNQAALDRSGAVAARGMMYQYCVLVLHDKLAEKDERYRTVGSFLAMELGGEAKAANFMASAVKYGHVSWKTALIEADAAVRKNYGVPNAQPPAEAVDVDE